jgi:exonuclease SbcC
MKILRIKLCNLASIAGEAEVDFEGEVLGRCPVFAVTGRTGSGKSTLLDAICLALYGKTPRYGSDRCTAPEIPGPEGARVRGDDPRNLLRRGTGLGWARTEYLGRDGCRYRARWEVRRARGRAEGNLQPAYALLERFRPGGIPAAGRAEAGDVCPETWVFVAEKGETEGAVARTLGLSFDQFRHAALLAQGEFKAFLDARPAERSALLEALTGTGIYTLLSKEAHRRGAEAERALTEREGQLASPELNPLAPEERVRREEERESLRLREGIMEERIAELGRWIRRHEELRAKEEELAAVRSGREVLEARAREHERDFRNLDDRGRAEPIRPVRERIDLLEGQRSEAEADRANLTGRVREGEESEFRRSAEEAEARKAREAARTAWDLLQPELRRARELDVRISAAEAEEKRARERRNDAAGRLEESRGNLRRIEEDRSGLAERVRRDEEILEGLRPVEGILRDAEGVAGRLEEARRRRGDLVGEEAEFRRLEEGARKLREKGDLLEERIRVARSEEATARTELESLRSERDLLDPEALREAREGLRERIARLEGLCSLREERRRCARELLVLREDAAARRERRSRAEVRLAEIRPSRERIEGESALLEETLRGLDRALSEDLEALRGELVEGRPCPLCGSSEHPWAAPEARGALGKELGAVRERLEEMRSRARSLNGEERELAAERAASEEALRGLFERSARLLSEREERFVRIRALLREVFAGNGKGALRAEAGGSPFPEIPPDGREEDRRAAAEGHEEATSGKPTHASVPVGSAMPSFPPVPVEGILSDEELNAPWFEGRLGVSEGENRGDGLPVRAEPGSEAKAECPEPEGNPVPSCPEDLPATVLLRSREILAETERRLAAALGLDRRIGDLLSRVEGQAREIRLREEERDRSAGAAVEAEKVRDRLGIRLEADRAWLHSLEEELRRTLAPRPEWLAALEIPGLPGAIRKAAGLLGEAEARLKSARERDEELRREEAAEARQEAERREFLETAREELGRTEADLEALRADRLAMLGGAGADEAERRARDRRSVADRALEEASATLAEERRGLEGLRGALAKLEERIGRIREEKEEAARLFRNFCAERGFSAERVEELLALDEARAREIRALRDRLTAERAALEGRAAALEEQRTALEERRPPLDREACGVEAESVVRERSALRERRETLALELGRDEEIRRRRAELEAGLPELRRGARLWGALREAIGSADGKKFRDYAQGLTLRVLVENANAHLGRLRPRYRLRGNENDPMDLVLEDRDMGGEIRSARSLSGGEGFLASLALALGLSDLASERQSIDSLFIDEGFGTLDGESLEAALAALQSLHAQGKQVGLVTHVEGVADRLGAEVRVETLAPGRSGVRVRRA